MNFLLKNFSYVFRDSRNRIILFISNEPRSTLQTRSSSSGRSGSSGKSGHSETSSKTSKTTKASKTSKTPEHADVSESSESPESSKSSQRSETLGSAETSETSGASGTPGTSSTPVISTRNWIWHAIGVTAIFSGICYGVYRRYIQEPKELAVLKERQTAYGESAIGGQFSLIDHKRRKRRSDDYRGSWILIFFGYTHCDEMCPQQVERMIAVANKLDKISGIPKVIPIMITVDPVRDTPEILAKYVRRFSNKLIALTGSPEDIKKLCKSFRVHVTEPPKDEDYKIDHSIVTYLINHKGEVVDFFDGNKTEEGMKSTIIVSMSNYEDKKKGLWKR